MSRDMSADSVAPIADLTNCDREPIHIPGNIQPHGVLLVLDAVTLTVLQASQNAEQLHGVSAESLIGRNLEHAIGPDVATRLASDLALVLPRSRPQLLRTVIPGFNQADHRFRAIVHRIDDLYILEFERMASTDTNFESAVDIHAQIDTYTLHAEEIRSIIDLCQLTAASIRQLTGFDRVLIYRFDEDWHGIVVGEDGNGQLPSLLQHRFPASDIPSQARELYRINRIRIIPDAFYEPVPVIPAINSRTRQSLDMSFCILRSVSPVHVEYMRNMETASSMSISILKEGRLWGLISCHHRRPRLVPFQTRGTCDLIARAFSLRLSALETIAAFERGLEVKSVFARLFAMMAERGDFATALTEHGDELLSFTGSTGAAVVTDRGCLLVGQTPGQDQVLELAAWLVSSGNEDVFSTDCLSRVYQPAKAYPETLCGLLAVAVSRIHPSYVMWFRPEVVTTIQWGGDPRKNIESTGGQIKIQPRQSFETWKEVVRWKSNPWTESEVEGAVELRNAIVGILLRKSEEISDLNKELTRSNRELEAFSYSVSHDLRAPLRHIVGYAEVLRESVADRLTAKEQRFINTIIESSEYAGRLVEKLLEYSRLGRAELQICDIDMNSMTAEVLQDMAPEYRKRTIQWEIQRLPNVRADLMMLRLALRNLLANAIKYTRTRDLPIIQIGAREDPDQTVFWVKDNGVGFDMQYSNKLFGVFQRLHRWEDYEGTGIGLANVLRVMERHHGNAWAEGQENQGATFYFSLPKGLTK